MILREISLVPFGGLSDTNLEFQDGLNVIQGPNEAGKSTVFNAIQKVMWSGKSGHSIKPLFAV